MTMPSSGPRYDVVVVGAGIVGLAHAYHWMRRGRSVAVVEHADGVSGASVQNFGHACITAQSGDALRYARAGREHWLRLSREAGFWARESGTLCVARHADELELIEQFAIGRDDVDVLTRSETLHRLPIEADDVTGGMYMVTDLQVDPRQAAPAIAQWLGTQGVDFHWRTAATGFAEGVVHTSRGALHAPDIVVCVNHDVDRLFPQLAERDQLQRCRLHMLRVTMPLRFALTAPLFTGWSLVRYSGFDDLPARAAVRHRLHTTHPVGAAVDLHQMYTPQPDGSILLGDTHFKDSSASPFQSEEGFAVLIEEAQRLFGVPVTVLERWQGLYCSAAGKEFQIEEPIPGVHVVTVTTGIGMTTSMGLAAEVVERAAARMLAEPG